LEDGSEHKKKQTGKNFKNVRFCSDFAQKFGLWAFFFFFPEFTIGFCSELLATNVGFAGCPLKQKRIFMDFDQHVV
jgi:hypothetical protein